MEFFKKHKNDIMLILAMLVLAGGIWVYTRCTRTKGGEAVITVDGITAGVLPLDEDAALTLEPGNGFAEGSGFANTVVVEAGRVCVQYANCPDRVCVRTGWIEYNGEMIVCLPHKLMVEIVGGEESGWDSVAN